MLSDGKAFQGAVARPVVVAVADEQELDWKHDFGASHWTRPADWMFWCLFQKPPVALVCCRWILARRRPVHEIKERRSPMVSGYSS